MKRINSLFSAALCAISLLLAGCEKEGNILAVDEYVPQLTDTVTYNSFFLDEGMKVDKSLFTDGSQFGPMATYLDGNDLYVANPVDKRVDLFDATTLVYKRSFSNGRTDARDVYVHGDQLFVGAGNSREVQIYDKKSGKYLTRLGTGNYNHSVSFAAAVAANEKFVFVCDSKGNGIKVFERSQINMTAVNNNSPFCWLDNDKVLVDQKNMNDIEFVGDSLYVFHHLSSTVYIYSLADVEAKKTGYARKVLLKEQGITMYSASVDAANGEVYVAMKVNQVSVIQKYSLADFKAMKLDKPLFSLPTAGNVAFPAICNIGFCGQRLLFPRASALESWMIKNAPVHVITPKK